MNDEIDGEKGIEAQEETAGQETSGPSEDLREQTAFDDDEPLLPPEEEKEGVMLNVGNVLAVIFIFVFASLALIYFLSGGKKKQKAGETKLGNAGEKYIPNFVSFANEEDVKVQNEGQQEPAIDNEDVDKILETLPDDLRIDEPPKSAAAPVQSAPIGSGSRYAERPDTRNSKSKRKIDGLIGLDFASQDKNNIDAVAAAMTNAYENPSPQARMSKEEFVSQKISEMQSLQNSAFGGGTGGGVSASQRNKQDFFESGSGDGSGQYLSYASLWDGTVISGALVTAINTDNPGMVVARVTENVYSSYDSSFLLIPEGSMLFATYNSSISYGQNKVQVAWNLLIRPDGYRVQLGNMNGVNAQGASGYKGRLNSHPFQVLKALGLVAVYSLIQTDVARSLDNNSNSDYVKNAMSDVYQQGAKIGNKIIDRALDIQPTITIKAGTEIKLITNIPLNLPPVKVEDVTNKYRRTR